MVKILVEPCYCDSAADYAAFVEAEKAAIAAGTIKSTETMPQCDCCGFWPTKVTVEE